ncbi:MAG: SGNH/GDSL hydrolase family protein [Actinomycetaceae bacterium]|nr:SGNH/GDSL hydrolase family protein [Actinomycetaceae bacterium]
MGAQSSTQEQVVFAVSSVDFLHGEVAYRVCDDNWIRPERFTKGQKDAIVAEGVRYPEIYADMVNCTSGISIEFTTDATHIEIEASVDELPSSSQKVIDDIISLRHSLDTPYDGCAVYVDGKFKGIHAPSDEESIIRIFLDGTEDTTPFTSIPEPQKDKQKTQKNPELTGDTLVYHHVKVWLPVLSGAKIRSIAVNGTHVTPVPKARPLFIMGDSLSQGFYTGNPALGYAAQLSRMLMCDIVNQSIGGQVFNAQTIADLSSYARPHRIIVQLGANYRYDACDEESVKKEIEEYFAALHDAFPDVRTYVITPTWHSDIIYRTHHKSCVESLPYILHEVVTAYDNMTYIDGATLLPRQFNLLADGDHPNTEGHNLIAQHIAQELAK